MSARFCFMPGYPCCLVLCLLSLTPGLAWAAGASPAELSEARRAYQAEREACISGRSHQDRATCLREAEAAYAEARRGGLTGAQGTGIEASADGEGTVRGSVESGGIYRELKLPAQP